MIQVFFLAILFFLPSSLFSDEEPPKIVINNRVLASVNGKIISVIDIAKKMDMVFYQRYPQYLEVPEFRYQFYQTSWKQMLSDLIDRELVIADAEEKNFPVSSGDVREELEDIFGPNMMINLDSAGLTLDDAWQLVKADIIIRRMLYYQVQSRVYAQVTPQDIRKKYEEYLRVNKEQEEYLWRAVSVKGSSQEQAVALGQAAYLLLKDEKLPIEEIQEKLQGHSLWNESLSVSLSPVYSQKRRELSESLLELFSSMEEGSYSQPLFQPSRSDRTPVVRLYYLQGIPKEDVKPINEVETQLRDEVMDQMISEETLAYFERLRHHFRVSKEQIEEELPQNFQPFEYK